MDNYEYNVGDTFPRKGLNVSDERLVELSHKREPSKQAPY